MPDNASPALASANPKRRFLSPSNTGLVLVLILSCQLMVVIDSTIVNVALHDIKIALGFSDTGLSWVINAYTLAFGGLLLLGARAGDVLGRKNVFLGGIALFTLASLLGGFAQNPAELLTARAVLGIGAAFAAPSALALLMGTFVTPSERAKAIGLYTAVSAGGSAVGLIAGGMLSEWASWRWVLFVNIPIGIALLALAIPALPTMKGHRGRFDLMGAITSTIGMTSLVYGFVHAAESGWSNPETIAAFLLGIFLLTAFAFIETRAEAPITPLRLLRSRNRITVYAARLLLTAGMLGMSFFLTQFLRGVLGYSDLQTGFAFVPLTIAVFTASQISSRVLVARFGDRRVMIFGLFFSTLGLLLLTQLNENSSYFALLLPLMVFGCGNGIAFVPLTSVGLAGVDPHDAGAASGLINVMQQLGGSLGLAVLVTVFGAARSNAIKSANPSLTPEHLANHVFVVGADKAFWVATGLLLAAWLLVIAMVRTNNHKVDEEQVELALDAQFAEI